MRDTPTLHWWTLPKINISSHSCNQGRTIIQPSTLYHIKIWKESSLKTSVTYPWQTNQRYQLLCIINSKIIQHLACKETTRSLYNNDKIVKILYPFEHHAYFGPKSGGVWTSRTPPGITPLSLVWAKSCSRAQNQLQGWCMALDMCSRQLIFFNN